MLVYLDFFGLPGSGSTIPEVDSGPAKLSGSGWIQIWIRNSAKQYYII